MEQAEELQIDQNQCRRLKGYYGFDHLKSVAEPAQPIKPTVCYRNSAGNARRRGYDSAATGILDAHL